jgi:hypothetical protein
MFGPATAHAVSSYPVSRIASSAPPPIDLDGTYALTPPVNGNCPYPSLVITEWTGSSPQPGGEEGVFESSEGTGAEWYDSVYQSGTSIGFGAAPNTNFTVSESGSTITIANQYGCTGVNTAAESLDSLPTISGTMTRSNGTPVGPGVWLNGTAAQPVDFGAGIRSDGSYEFWVQPANTYTVSPEPVSGIPPYILTTCTGHKVPLPNGCTFVVYPSNPPNTGTASWVFPNGIGGTVSDTDGLPIAGIEVTLSGTDSATGKPVSMQAVSASDGSYTFELSPGVYSVTAGPDPAGGQFLVTACSGTSAEEKCSITLKSGHFDTADFRRATLLVNSTELGMDKSQADQGICDITPTASKQTCTLPQAILVSNDLGGQPIGFDIPDSGGTVPQISDPKGAGMPAVTAPAIIDGTSQPGSAKIELSGTSAKNDTGTITPTVGLTLSAASTVEGLVINGYSDGIDVKASPSTIQGDWFGTDSAGTAALPNPLGTNKVPNQLAAQIGVDVTVPGNQIGGAGPGQGDVFATDWGESGPGAQTRASAAIYDTSGGNTIQGNSVGVVPDTSTPIIDPPPNSVFPPSPGLAVTGSDIVGGASAGDANVVAPEAFPGDSTVEGNTFFGTVYPTDKAQIGGPTTTPGTGPGNVFSPTIGAATTFLRDRELDIGGKGAVVQGNLFNPTSDPAIVVLGDSVTIGGTATNDGNVIDRTATERTGADGQRNEVDGAIVLRGNHNIVENNHLTKNGGWGAVQIFGGTGNTVTRNSMSDNSLGIEFGTLGYVYDTDISKSPSGPNDLEYYPLLFSTNASSGTTVSGRIEQAGMVTVDLYSQKTCSLQSETPGQGDHYLGSTTVSSTFGGEAFTFTAAPVPSGDTAITATATAADGSTSEFSPCLYTDSHAPSLVGYGVTPALSTVAISAATAASPSDVGSQSSAGTGKGTLTLLCPPNTVGSCTGTVHVKTTGSHPKTITSASFTMSPGCAALVPIALSRSLFAALKKAHLAADVTTTAHDRAKPRHTKTVTTKITLVDK